MTKYWTNSNEGLGDFHLQPNMFMDFTAIYFPRKKEKI